jgi:hypothetical protein
MPSPPTLGFGVLVIVTFVWACCAGTYKCCDEDGKREVNCKEFQAMRTQQGTRSSGLFAFITVFVRNYWCMA